MYNEKLIIHSVGFQSNADLDVNDDNEIENYDELVDAGKTFDEIRVLKNTEQNREHLSDSMILDEDDPMWREEYADMDVGESKKLTT